MAEAGLEVEVCVDAVGAESLDFLTPDMKVEGRITELAQLDYFQVFEWAEASEFEKGVDDDLGRPSEGRRLQEPHLCLPIQHREVGRLLCCDPVRVGISHDRVPGRGLGVPHDGC